jgi:hypothetical protein
MEPLSFARSRPAGASSYSALQCCEVRFGFCKDNLKAGNAKAPGIRKCLARIRNIEAFLTLDDGGLATAAGTRFPGDCGFGNTGGSVDERRDFIF